MQCYIVQNTLLHTAFSAVLQIEFVHTKECYILSRMMVRITNTIYNWFAKFQHQISQLTNNSDLLANVHIQFNHIG